MTPNESASAVTPASPIGNMQLALLSSYGRSGSTLLMKVLSKHPQIVVRTLHPFETRAAQYYFVCSNHRRESPSYEPVLYGNVEYLPHQGADEKSRAWRVTEGSPSLDNHGFEFACKYYQFVAKLEGKQGVNTIAEKVVGLQVVEELLDAFGTRARAIYLFRDPRDVFLSVKAFNEKRGFLSFGEERGDEELLLSIIHFQKAAAQSVLNDPERRLAASYENLLERRVATVTRVFEGLHLGADDDIVDKVVAEAFKQDRHFLEHSTSQSSESSVRRWITCENAEARKLFERFDENISALEHCVMQAQQVP